MLWGEGEPHPIAVEEQGFWRIADKGYYVRVDFEGPLCLTFADASDGGSEHAESHERIWLASTVLYVASGSVAQLDPSQR